MEELDEISSEQRGVHCPPTRKDAAIRELGVPLPPGMHGKREQWPAFDVGGDDGVAARVSDGRDDPVEPSQRLAVGVGSDHEGARARPGGRALGSHGRGDRI